MPIAFYTVQEFARRSLKVKILSKSTFCAPPATLYTVACRSAALKNPFPVFIPIIVVACEWCHHILKAAMLLKVFLIIDLGSIETVIPFSWCVNKIGTGKLKLTIHIVSMKSRFHSIYGRKYGPGSSFRWPARYADWVIKSILPPCEPQIISSHKWDACQKHTHGYEHPGDW